MVEDETKKKIYRQHKRMVATIISIVAVLYVLYHVFFITGLLASMRIFLDTPVHLAIHLGSILLLTFLLLPFTEKSSRFHSPWYDVVLALLGLGWNLYMVINYDALYQRSVIGYLEMYEYVGTWINMLIVLEACRRIMGWVIPGICIFALVYAIFTNYFPGFLYAPGHDWTRVARYIGLFVTGMYGDILSIAATIVISFIMFSQFLFVTGAGSWFIEMAEALLGHVRGGLAKIAVVASAVIGGLTGSAMADAATTGVLTIPMMIKNGYKNQIAAAIECAAANGGQITPPVMGISAFLMVDFLGVSYTRVMLAGILPALAYYTALFLMVDFEAIKNGLKGIPRNELPSLRKTFAKGWQFLIAVLFLLFFLVFLKYSPQLSAIYSTGLLIIISLFREEYRITPDKFLLALKNTAVVMLMLTIVMATSGIIVGSVQLTGLGYRLSNGLIALSGGNMWVLLLLTAFAAIILGTGLNTSAVYLILAVLVAPALTQVGFPAIAVHFFLLYYGTASLISPPVAPTAFITAGIANADPMKVGWDGMRWVSVTFIAPFIFIFHPALLMQGGITDIIFTSAYTFLSSVAIAAGLVGYFFGKLNIWWRILFVTMAAAVLMPQVIIVLVDSVAMIGVFLLKFVLSKMANKAKVAGELA